MDNKRVAIVVLAAGKSTRMGRPKQLLPINETTLLASVLTAALSSRAEKVFCILGANHQIIKKSIEHLKVEVMINADFDEGLSSSVGTGITAADNELFDSVLLMLGDQPKIRTEYLNLLIDLQKGCESKVIASSYEDRAGVPAIVPKKYFEELTNLQGDHGARSFLNENPNVDMIDCDQLIDVDTIEDYRNLVQTSD